MTETQQNSLTKFLCVPPASQQGKPELGRFEPEEMKEGTTASSEGTNNNKAQNRLSNNFHDRFAKAKKEIKKKQEEQMMRAVGFCREHQAVKELVCLSGCQCRVCPHCALFGVHQGHDVREEQQVLALIGDHSKSLNQMLEDLRSAQ